jgi:hypothetical protein
MADDRANRGAGDRVRINLKERHEVNYWTKTFDVDEATLRRAVTAAGPDVAAVREYLRRKPPRTTH